MSSINKSALSDIDHRCARHRQTEPGGQPCSYAAVTRSVTSTDSTQQLLGTTSRPAVMPMDAWREGDHFVIEFDLPGVARENVDLDVERNVPDRPRASAWLATATWRCWPARGRCGAFSRQLVLGDNLDLDRIEADYDAGVLRLVVPVSAEGQAAKDRGRRSTGLFAASGDRGLTQASQLARPGRPHGRRRLAPSGPAVGPPLVTQGPAPSHNLATIPNRSHAHPVFAKGTGSSSKPLRVRRHQPLSVTHAGRIDLSHRVPIQIEQLLSGQAKPAAWSTMTLPSTTLPAASSPTTTDRCGASSAA